MLGIADIRVVVFGWRRRGALTSTHPGVLFPAKKHPGSIWRARLPSVKDAHACTLTMRIS